MGVEDKPAYLPKRRELHYTGPAHFATYVPFETVNNALFNYWEPSLSIDTPINSHATVYLSNVDNYNPEGALNLVVIEEVRRANGRTRVDWYFGTFRGKPRGETTDEEVEIFDQNVEHVRSRHHRVAGSELDALIRHAAKLDDPVF